MQPLVTGIHHVTAFAGDAARNRRFYTDVLGFALVKRTVNFDAPSMWHLYYGHAAGAPGTLVTHFPEPRAARARHGGHEIASVTLGLQAGGLDALASRLGRAGVRFARTSVLAQPTLAFEDPDGMRVLAEECAAFQQPQADAEVARVTLAVPDSDETCAFLVEVMGFSSKAREDTLARLSIDGGGSGREIDVVHAPHLAAEQLAAGTIHHVAWRVPDGAAQERATRALSRAGVAVTPVRDRQYFRSVYFRIPGGVLFEIATDGPGFAVDEAPSALGRTLCLPPRYEPQRALLAATLPPLD